MTRYRDDFDCPVAFEEQTVTRRWPRSAPSTESASCTSPRPRSTRTSPTSSTAAARTSGPARRGSLPVTARRPELRPQARDVGRAGRRGVRPGARRRRLRVRDREPGEPDMVGHTGSIPAVVKAVEATDAALGRILGRGGARRRNRLVTADHGNAEEMLDSHGNPQTAHTSNPVPLVVTDPDVSLRTGWN